MVQPDQNQEDTLLAAVAVAIGQGWFPGKTGGGRGGGENAEGDDGTANTGSGGGGAGGGPQNINGGDGASGIIIVRYLE